MKERWEKTLLCRIGNIENARALYGAPCRLSIYLCNLATQNFISLFIYLPCCNRLQCRNWKLKPWRERKQYSQGKIGFFCCMIGKVHLEGGGGEVTSFWWAQRNVVRETGSPHMVIYTLSMQCAHRPQAFLSVLEHLEGLIASWKSNPCQYCPILHSAPWTEAYICFHCATWVSAPGTEQYLDIISPLFLEKCSEFRKTQNKCENCLTDRVLWALLSGRLCSEHKWFAKATQSYLNIPKRIEISTILGAKRHSVTRLAR